MEGKQTNFRTTFVRHNFWMNKLWVPYSKFMSNFSAMSYKSAFGREKA